MRLFFTILISCISLTTLFSQTVHEDGMMGKEHCNRQDMTVLHTQKIAFFTQYLDLSTQEAEKFWPVYNEFWKKRAIAHKNTKVSLKKLNLALNGEKSLTDNDIKVLMDSFLENHKAEEAVFGVMFNEIQKVLPLRKTAKLVSAEEEFRIMLIRQLKEKK